jgi:hypothetical protein
LVVVVVVVVVGVVVGRAWLTCAAGPAAREEWLSEQALRARTATTIRTLGTWRTITPAVGPGGDLGEPSQVTCRGDQSPSISGLSAGVGVLDD